MTTRASNVIAYAKQLDVSRLDPTLPKRPLDQWMRDSGAPADATHWDFVSNCDLKGAETNTRPCVQFTILHGTAGIRGLIEVGTMGDGVTGEPRLLNLRLMRDWPTNTKAPNPQRSYQSCHDSSKN